MVGEREKGKEKRGERVFPKKKFSRERRIEGSEERRERGEREKRREKDKGREN